MKGLFLTLAWFVLTACLTTVTPVVNAPNPMPPSSPSNYGGIEIRGSTKFITQTASALDLLEQKAPDAFQKVQTYIGIIEQGEHSGMWAWETPPRYEVGDATAFFSITWYASTIAHDATHSELYAQYQATHPGEPVPDNAFGGVKVSGSASAINWRSPSVSALHKARSATSHLSTARTAISMMTATAIGRIVRTGIGR